MDILSKENTAGAKLINMFITYDTVVHL